MRTAKPLPPCLRSLLPFVGFCRLAARLLLSRSSTLPGERAQVGHLALAHPLHQLLHLPPCVEESVDLLDARARAARDALAPRSVDHARQAALLRRHRQDDRLDATELLLVDLLHAVELLAESGNELQQALDRPHAAQHPVGLQKVVEAELALEHAGLELLLL